jgi:hypothetical protein
MLMKTIPLLLLLVSLSSLHCMAQSALPASEEDFKKELLALRADVNNIQYNLEASHNKFKWGIATATLGYTVTIAGGLLLANGDVDPGRVLLITGGAIGITGTFLLVDAFKYLGRAGDKSTVPPSK